MIAKHKTRLTVTIDKKTYSLLSHYCKDIGLTKSDVVNMFLAKSLFSCLDKEEREVIMFDKKGS